MHNRGVYARAVPVENSARRGRQFEMETAMCRAIYASNVGFPEAEKSWVRGRHVAYTFEAADAIMSKLVKWS
jgi:hypothetical protein